MISIKEKEIIAVLFASGEPIEAAKLAEAIEIDEDLLSKLIVHLTDKLDDDGFPLQILKLGTKYQLSTLPIYAEPIKKALEVKRNLPLSQASMEILAIIAYNQPVTKSFIEQIRGVDSGSTVNSLVDKGLVEEAGRMEIPGRPISYVTTSTFLRCFGISSLEQLPEIKLNEENSGLKTEEVDEI